MAVLIARIGLKLEESKEFKDADDCGWIPVSTTIPQYAVLKRMRHIDGFEVGEATSVSYPSAVDPQ